MAVIRNREEGLEWENPNEMTKSIASYEDRANKIMFEVNENELKIRTVELMSMQSF